MSMTTDTGAAVVRSLIPARLDLSMECAGLPVPGRYFYGGRRPGRPVAREFIAFWLSGGRVIAGMNVNVWDVTDDIQALIRSGKVVDVDAHRDPRQV